jgi:hypothetical protein
VQASTPGRVADRIGVPPRPGAAAVTDEERHVIDPQAVWQFEQEAQRDDWFRILSRIDAVRVELSSRELFHTRPSTVPDHKGGRF